MRAPDIAHRLLRVPAEELSGIGQLATGVGQALAVLQRDQAGEAFALAGQHLEGLAQNLAAFARFPGRPAGESGLRGIHRGARVLDAGAGDRGDRGLSGRVDHVEALAVGRGLPFSADIEVGGDIGGEIVKGLIHGNHL
jgi:hypothetical protein